MVEISGSLVAAECWRARETISKPLSRHQAGKVVGSIMTLSSIIRLSSVVEPMSSDFAG
jgi:hypothetical protein